MLVCPAVRPVAGETFHTLFWSSLCATPVVALAPGRFFFFLTFLFSFLFLFFFFPNFFFSFFSFQPRLDIDQDPETSTWTLIQLIGGRGGHVYSKKSRNDPRLFFRPVPAGLHHKKNARGSKNYAFISKRQVVIIALGFCRQVLEAEAGS